MNLRGEPIHEHTVRVGGIASPRPQPFANIRADLRAHGGDWLAPGFWTLMVYRFGRWRYGIRSFALRRLMAGFYWVAYKLVKSILGISLPCEVVIGRNLVIAYSGNITVSSYTSIGDDCCIRSGLYVAHIGNNVDIGAGARLINRINVGDNVVIDANCVVTHDVPGDSVVICT
ncbi:MAG: DapH/DapD/GlmU-related protein [Pseudomonadota bacterium]